MKMFIVRTNRNYLGILVLAIIALQLASCKSRDWSEAVETYPQLQCKMSTLYPSQPFCLTRLDTSDGFKYRGEARACRSSVKNYGEALQHWKICEIDLVTSKVLLLIDETQRASECLNLRDGFAVSDCIQIGFTEVSMGQSIYAPPSCLNNKLIGFVGILALEECRRAAKEFPDELHAGLERYIETLLQKIQEDFSVAVDTYNCIATRQKPCFYR